MADFVPLMGYQPNPKATEAFLASLPRPLLADAGPGLQLDTTRDVFLGQYLLRCDPRWKRGSQKIGSCTGWAWGLSCDLLASCDVLLRNESEVYGGRVLEASIYGPSRVEIRGQRNLGGDGSYGSACAKAVTKIGTLHYGIDYGGGHRYTQNSGTLEKEWGRDGMPDELEPFAAKHKVSSVALVKTFEDAAKAIQNGYPVAVCSMRGFSMTLRDGGYLTPMGTWAHAMCFCGLRWSPRSALLCANSWGDCYDGSVDPNLPPQFQKSAGWVDADVCTSMLSGDDSFALSGYSGFQPRELPNWTGVVL